MSFRVELHKFESSTLKNVKFNMKKVLLSALAFTAMTSLAMAQGKGGYPWSYQYSERGVTVNSATLSFPSLNMDEIREQDQAAEVSMIPQPTRVAFPVSAHVNLSNAGKFTYLENGDIIWSAKVSIPGAKVIDAYFDQFDLPKGVKLYFFNENKRQIDGFYDESAEDEFNTFRSDLVQGDVLNIELNIPAGTDLSKVQFNINKFGAYYRGGIAMQVAQVYSGNGVTVDATQQDDACHTNANCENYGTTYYQAKQTAAHIDMGGYVCSGNLINNTAQDCKPLFITASHCEGTSSFRDATFSRWRFYFNYETETCPAGGPVNVAQYVTGAKFKTRSVLPSASNPNDQSLRADHLLLELNTTKEVLESYDAYLGGWDRMLDVPTAPAEKLWVNFSHPNGLRKKIMMSNEMTGDGTFNQGTIQNTHWEIGNHTVGGTQGGSSGSALFHAPTQRIIGVLSGGPAAVGDPNCPNIKKANSLFAKLTRAWSNTAGEGGNTDTTALRKHLDPIGSNVMAIDGKKVEAGNCQANTSVGQINALQAGLTLYPNPAANQLNVKFNMRNGVKYSMTINDMFGKTLGKYDLTSGQSLIDVSTFANGMYIITLTDGTNIATQKVVITK